MARYKAQRPYNTLGAWTEICHQFLVKEEDTWLSWAPVALSAGISCYLALPCEPTWKQYAWGMGALGLVMGLIKFFLKPRWPQGRLFFLGGITYMAAGFGLMMHRTQTLDPTMLTKPCTLRLQGRVTAIEHVATQKKLFHRVVLEDITYCKKWNPKKKSPKKFPKSTKNSYEHFSQKMGRRESYNGDPLLAMALGARCLYKLSKCKFKESLMEQHSFFPHPRGMMHAWKNAPKILGENLKDSFLTRHYPALTDLEESYNGFPKGPESPDKKKTPHDGPFFSPIKIAHPRIVPKNPFHGRWVFFTQRKTRLMKQGVFRGPHLPSLGQSHKFLQNYFLSKPWIDEDFFYKNRTLKTQEITQKNHTEQIINSAFYKKKRKEACKKTLKKNLGHGLKKNPKLPPEILGRNPQPKLLKKNGFEKNLGTSYKDYEAMAQPYDAHQSHVFTESKTSPRDKRPKLPRAIRLTIRTPCSPLYVGDVVTALVQLMPFPPAAFSGGYDAYSHHFFQGIGARGYTLSRVSLKARHPGIMDTLRQRLTRTFHAKLPSPQAAMACALITGDKAALPKTLKEDFSTSGLSHLLAISGLHLSLVSGASFGLLQRLLAIWPFLALSYNLQIISAILALLLSGVYFFLSGAGYPVIRSFFMVAGSLMAMTAGRWAYSLRLLSLCALAILLVQPEALLNLSFQLSFVAVAAVLAGGMAPKNPMPEPIMQAWPIAQKFSPKRTYKPLYIRGFLSLAKAVAGTLLTTTAVTFATLPITAYYFHQISLQSLLSNVVAIPFTSLCLMPLGALVTILSLAGYDSQGLFDLWGYCLYLLARFAHKVSANLDMISFSVIPYDAMGFILSMAGVFWVLLWKQPWRWWGMVAWIAGWLLALVTAHKPALFIDTGNELLAWPDYHQRVLWVAGSRKGKFNIAMWCKVFGLHTVRFIKNFQECPLLLKTLFSMISRTKGEEGLPKNLFPTLQQENWTSSILWVFPPNLVTLVYLKGKPPQPWYKPYTQTPRPWQPSLNSS